MKIKLYPGALFGYLCIIVLFRFISLFVDANLGTSILVVFCTIIAISVLMLFVNVSFIKVNCKNSDIKILKNDRFLYYVSVTSSLPIGFCIVEIKMKPQEYLKLINKDYHVSMVDSGSPINAAFEYKAGVFGEDVVGLDYVWFRDFMGLIVIKKKIRSSEITVKTLPKYIENFYDRSVMIFNKYAVDYDDSEEINGSLNSTTGFPGYEHREFQDGDSLKRVNYKISAKKEKLMVRLDEPVANLRQAVILDNFSSKDRYMDEITLEGFLSYIGCLVKNKITTEIYFVLNGKKEMFTVTNERDFSAFIDLIGNTCFFNPDELENDDKIREYEIYRCNRLSSMVVFSPVGKNADKYISNMGIPYYIITPNYEVTGNTILYIDEHLNISKGGNKHEGN